MRSSRAIVLISAFVLFAEAAAPPSHVDSVARGSSYLSLAEEYAPVIYQETRSVVLDRGPIADLLR